MRLIDPFTGLIILHLFLQCYRPARTEIYKMFIIRVVYSSMKLTQCDLHSEV